MAVIGVKSITGITSITNAAGGADVLTFHSNNTTERLRIASNGRVGINSTVPQTNLDVQGGEIYYHSGTSNNLGIKLTYSNSNSTGIIDTYGNHPLEVRVNNSEKLRIKNDGKVGIGTNNPATKLHLQDGSFTIKSSGECGPYLYRNNGSGPDLVFHSNRGSSFTSPTASGGTDLLGNINFAGYDGSSYQRRATINGTIDGTVGSGNVPTAIIFRTGTTSAIERLRIDSNGKIGVGLAPNAWQSSTTSKLIQIGNGSVWDYNLQQFDLGQNFYYDGTNYKYIANGYATKLAQLKSSGDFVFYNAASGTGGNNLTWLEKLKVNNGYAGTVDVKGIPAHLRLNSLRDTSDWDATDPIGKLDFYVGSDTTNNLPYNAGFIHCLNEVDNTGEPSGALVFGTTTANLSGGAVERVRITSAGNVTKPYQVAWTMHSTNGMTNFQSGDKVAFNQTGTGFGNFNSTRNHSSISTSGHSFTAPVAGLYLTIVTMFFYADNMSNICSVVPRINNNQLSNGNDTIFYFAVQEESDTTATSGSLLLQLAKDDVLTVHSRTGNSGTHKYYGAHCQFQGVLIG